MVAYSSTGTKTLLVT